MKKKIIFLTILGALVVTSIAMAKVNDKPIVKPGNVKNTIALKATTTAVDLVCMQNAIEKRDTAVIAAWDKYAAAIKTALEARKTALKQAWTIAEKKARRTAIKKAWTDYKTAIKSARKTSEKERNAAWKQFKTDAKACRGTDDDAANLMMSSDGNI